MSIPEKLIKLKNLKEKVDELTIEVNKKDGQNNELLADIGVMKEKEEKMEIAE